MTMRLIADSRMVGMFKTQARRFVWTNAACTQMLGYDEHELIGQPTRQLYPDEQSYAEYGLQLYASDGPGEIAHTASFLRKDGSRGWYALHARRLNPASDELIGLFVDVSQHKQLEEKLRQSNEHLEMALTSSSTGTWLYDFTKDRFVLDSRTAVIFGFASEDIELTMQGWLDLIHLTDLPRVQAVLSAHMSGDSPYLVLEYRVRHQKGGHWIAVVSHGKVSWHADGTLAMAGGIVRDVSDLKRLEEEGGDLLLKIETLLRDFTQHNEPGRKRLTGLALAGRKEPPLSKRHREVLELIAAGLTSAQIAERLNISHATVLTHRRNLLRKLEVHSVAELTRYAIEHRIVSA